MIVLNQFMARVLFLILIVVFRGIVLVQKLRTKRNLRTLAAQLGFSVTPDLRIPGIKRSCRTRSFGGIAAKSDLPKEIGIMGRLRGKLVRFSVFTTPKFRGKNYWAEMAVAVRAHHFTFCIHQNNISANLMETPAGGKIKLGDDELDERLRILTNDPEKIKNC